MECSELITIVKVNIITLPCRAETNEIQNKEEKEYSQFASEM